MVRVTAWASIVFGEHVKRARHARGLTQDQLANRTDMHASNVRRMERGDANPSLSTMTRVAAALEVEVADLVRGIPRREP